MKYYDIGGVTTALINLLSTDRDGLILLDGKWGAGKSHYINNCFRITYQDKPIFIISTLGLTSLDDFKSALFSVFYLEKPEEIEQANHMVTSLTAIITKTPSVAAPLKSFISSIGAGIKNKVLSNLNGVFAIDDIERIKPELAEDILGYCHSAYINGGNEIDFIIVSNTDSESGLAIKNKEKLISDIVPFTPSEEDIYTLFETELSTLGSEYTTYLKKSIKQHGTTNIRIIRQIIKQLSPVFKFHKDYPEKEVTTNLELIISSFCAINILAREHSYTLDMLEEKKDTLHIKKDTSDEDKLLDRANHPNIPTAVKKYSFNLASLKDVTDALFQDKINIPLEKQVLAVNLSEIEASEIEIVEALQKIIDKGNGCSLKDWCRAVEIYREAIENKYIAEDKKRDVTYIMNIADLFTSEQVKDYLPFDTTRQATEEEINKSREDGNIKSYLKTKYSYEEKPKLIEAMRNDILQYGWSLFNTQRIDDIGNNSKYKPLEILSVRVLTIAITEKWKAKDIERFGHYLKNLYNFDNIQDYLNNELYFLRELSLNLDAYISNNKYSFKFGAISELKTSLNAFIKRLTRN
ncbi:P-loop NTPase fold protein [Serratia nevei]|uniref:P-loop NTPase fold protein n=1 Tax=Serratia nevei TaxID=2703794 RepID=UPI003FA6D736